MSDSESDSDLAEERYDVEDDVNYYGSPKSPSVREAVSSSEQAGILTAVVPDFVRTQFCSCKNTCCRASGRKKRGCPCRDEALLCADQCSCGTKKASCFYCVYKSSDSTCSNLGMKEGYMKLDDEDKDNNNKKYGILPDGTYDEDTTIKYCCQDEGHWSNSVKLPVDQPFYLMPYKSSSTKYPKCQLVKWAMSWLEYIQYHTSGYKNADESGGSHVFMEFVGGKPKIYYCYYKGCRYKMTENSGSFASPNSHIHDIYPQFQFCSWLVTVSKTYVVLLNVTYLNVPNCDENFLKIFDGVDETAPLLKTYCGSNATSRSTIVSSTNNMYMILKSGTYLKDAKVRVGFEANYTTQIKPTGWHCMIVGDNGSFISPNLHLPFSYFQVRNWSWLVKVRNNLVVLLNFTYLYVPNCEKSFVKIYDGVNETAPLLKTYCGLNASSGSTIVSSTNNLLVILKSGAYLKDAKLRVGFQAKYTTQLKATETTTIVSSSSVNTTNGPSTLRSSQPADISNQSSNNLPITYIIIPVVTGITIILLITIIVIYMRRKRRKTVCSNDSRGLNRSYEMRKNATVSHETESESYATPSSPAEKLWSGTCNISKEGRNPVYEPADGNLYCSTDNGTYEAAVAQAQNSENPLYNTPDVQPLYTEPST